MILIPCLSLANFKTIAEEALVCRRCAYGKLCEVVIGLLKSYKLSEGFF